MPYVDELTRAYLDESIVTKVSERGVDLAITYPAVKTAGELNYRLTMECIRYLQENGLNYSKINDIVGALEGAKMEFYRRVAIPYENKKIKENGDVYPSEFSQTEKMGRTVDEQSQGDFFVEQRSVD